jgi:hypothetical protein
MADRLYNVSWHPGTIKVHAGSAKEAIQIATEYIIQPEANRITAELAAETVSEQLDR